MKFLKIFIDDFFDYPPESKDAGGLANEITNGFKKLSNILENYLSQSSNFPFLNILRGVKNTLETAEKKTSIGF